VATEKLTKTIVEGLSAPTRGKTFLWDKTVAGFGVYVTPKGTRVFIVQYRMGGRGSPTRRYTIGRHGSPWTVDKARDRARELLYEVAQGIDPQLKEQEERTAAVVDEALRVRNYVETFDKFHLQARNLRSAKSTRRLLNQDVVPALGDRPLNSITRQDIVKLLDQLTLRSKGAANHNYCALSAMFNFAFRRGDIDRNPIQGLSKPHKFNYRQRVLSDWELLRAWEAAHDLGHPHGTAIQMLILTGQRLKEVCDAVWEEIDLHDNLWTLPAKRTKNKRTHMLPITEFMRAFFDVHWPAQGRSGRLFLTARGCKLTNFAITKKRFDAAVARRVDLAMAASPSSPGRKIEYFQFHDLRRTLATGLRRLSISLETTEGVLNHISGTRSSLVETYQVYDLAPEKQRALADWHRHIEKLIESPDAFPGGKELPPLQNPPRKRK
jgi:integrase